MKPLMRGDTRGGARKFTVRWSQEKGFGKVLRIVLETGSEGIEKDSRLVYVIREDAIESE